MTERDLHYFLDATFAYFDKFTGNSASFGAPTIEFQSLIFSEYTALSQISGRGDGFLYLTTTRALLQDLLHASGRRPRGPINEACLSYVGEIVGTLANQVRPRFGDNLSLASPRTFSAVPDDAIEMPPAVFVVPITWQNNEAYFVLGLTDNEQPDAPLAV